MAARLYLVPSIGGSGFFDPRRPKYISALGVSWGAMDYGFQPLFLVGADLSVADDAAVTANADVFAFPVGLGGTVGAGNVQTARDAFELALIPAQWVVNSSTWISVARTIAGMFQFMQRLNVMLGNTLLIDDAAKLNIRWSTIPIDIQTGITAAAQSFGYDMSFITANTQLRVILKSFADAWGDKTFIIGPITL